MEALIVCGIAAANGSTVFVPVLVARLAEWLTSNSGMDQISPSEYWKRVLGCDEEDPSRIVDVYEEAWWNEPYDDDVQFTQWARYEERRYGPGWVKPAGDCPHLFTYSKQVRRDSTSCLRNGRRHTCSQSFKVGYNWRETALPATPVPQQRLLELTMFRDHLQASILETEAAYKAQEISILHSEKQLDDLTLMREVVAQALMADRDQGGAAHGLGRCEGAEKEH